MARKTRIERATRRRRVHRAALSSRTIRNFVDLKLKNYALESHPEFGV